MAHFLAVVLAFAGGPAAEPEVVDRIEFRWEAPQECPDEATVRRAISDYLGREHYGAALDDVRVRAQVLAPRRAADPFRLQVSVQLPLGQVQREVTAANCADLGGAAALIIAVALDPLRVQQQAPVPPTPTAPPPTAVPSPPPPRRVRVDVRLGGGFAAGAVGGFAGVAAGEAALVRRRFRAALVGRYLTPRTVHPFQSSPDAGARVSGGTVAARLCFVPSIFRVEFPSCAEGEAGALRARGVGLPDVRTSHRPMVAVGLGQEVLWHAPAAVGVFAAADASIWVLRPKFAVEGLGQVFLAGLGSFRLVAGLSARF